MPRIPFTDLLDALRQARVPIGVQDYQAVARLLDRWDGNSLAELRTALAALLAAKDEEVALIGEAFDAFYVEHPDAGGGTIETAPPRWTEGLRAWQVGVASAVLALAVWALTVQSSQPPPIFPDPPRNLTPSNITPPSVAAPELPAPPTLRDTAMLPLASAFAGVLIGGVLWQRRTRSVDAAAARGARRERLSRQDGPYYYAPAAPPGQPLEMRRATGDAATILARRFAEGMPTDELDVDESLAETLRQGLRPHLVFVTPPVASPIVVLRDVGTDMRFWNRKIDLFLSQLIRGGVRLDLWYFDEDASLVSREPHGRCLPLSTLAARNDGAALLVISTGAGVPASLDRREHAWLPVLQQWHDRAWLTPISHPLYWRRELRQPQIMRLPVWPMTRAGIVDAARALTGGNTRSDVRPMPGVRAVSVDDVERMKRLVALVPYPSLELAEQLRQRFLPAVPEDVLLFLAEEGAGRAADTVRLDDAEIRRLASAQRRDDPVQELAVRRFLRTMLETSEPAARSVAHSRWQLDLAIQQLHLSALAPDDYRAPTVIVEALANGPLADEVSDALRLAAAASGRSQAAARLQRRAAASTTTAGLRDRPASRWTWPGLAEPIAGLIAALLVFAVLDEWGPFPSRVIAHETDAYSLEFVESESNAVTGSLRAVRTPGRPATPATADLYRGDERVGTMSFVNEDTTIATSDRDPRGGWYSLRATLPSGNLAVSNFAWVPPPAGETAVVDRKLPDPILPVTVVVDLRPWANVRITSPDGTGVPLSTTEVFVTPFSVRLLPGNYVLECENGGLTPARSLAVTVAPSNQPQFVTDVMPGFNPNRLVDNLIGQTSKSK